MNLNRLAYQRLVHRWSKKIPHCFSYFLRHCLTILTLSKEQKNCFPCSLFWRPPGSASLAPQKFGEQAEEARKQGAFVITPDLYDYIGDRRVTYRKGAHYKFECKGKNHYFGCFDQNRVSSRGLYNLIF